MKKPAKKKQPVSRSTKGASIYMYISVDVLVLRLHHYRQTEPTQFPELRPRVAASASGYADAPAAGHSGVVEARRYGTARAESMMDSRGRRRSPPTTPSTWPQPFLAMAELRPAICFL